MSETFDIAIIGAGIAGASIAYFIGDRARVVLIEGESQPGYHTTGRSAAFYAETYGGPAVQPLTSESKPFLLNPPAGFAEHPLLIPRGGLHLGHAAALDRLARDYEGTEVRIEWLGPAEVEARMPMLRPEWRQVALWEPDCRDIDVAALHQGFLKGARRAGTRLMTDASVQSLTREGGQWRIKTAVGTVTADLVVNAAGAWGDTVARLAGAWPIGLVPMRRTVAVVRVTPAPAANMPLVLDAEGRFYFKPDAGHLWVSPQDETPVDPSDVRPEELDVAIALDRLKQTTNWHIAKLERAWAGLRTFAPDCIPVYGFDPHTPGFFWCVGQGGFGIQTAPAAGEMAAGLVLNRPTSLRVDAKRYALDRW